MSDIKVAPKGKFRVVGFDSFDGTDWIDGDFDTSGAAIAHAQDRARDGVMMKFYVYDDRGNHLYTYSSGY